MKYIALLAPLAGCLVGDVEDDGPTFDSLAKKSVTIVQHNVEKKQGPIDNAIQSAQQTGALGITLEEVCPDQLARLQQAHGSEWTIGYVQQKHTPSEGCDNAAGGHDIPFVVAIWTGGTTGTVQPFASLGAPAAAPGEMVCVSFTFAKLASHLCAAHLISAKWTDPATGTTYDGDDVRKHQIKHVADVNHAWVHAGDVAIVAGDFNGQPDTAPLDQMYVPALGGTGDFTEYNRTSGRDGTDTAHANGDNTDDGLPYAKKIDYVFFSRNHAPLAGAMPTFQKDTSDHDMVTSVAQIAK